MFVEYNFFTFFQSQWERRILKSLNSMCCELGLCLAKPRCKDEQNEIGNLISDTFESILTS